MPYIKAWMSSKFSQIRSGTTELDALEHLKIDVASFLVSQLWLYLKKKSQMSVYRTIGPLVKLAGNEDMHNILDKFEFWPDWIIDLSV